jgi:zinc protease
LRDRQGLAYNVSATITADAGDEPGAFTCFIGTFPDKLSAVKKEIAGELERIRGSQPATKEEVENAKKYLLGSLPFHFATSASVAEELLHIERFGLGFDYRAKFRQAVSSVTPEDVLAVARQYLDPAHLVIVAAGPVRADGQPAPLEK